MLDWLNLDRLFTAIQKGILGLMSMDLSQVQYSNKNPAIVTAIIFGLVVAVKLLLVFLGRNQSTRQDSGYFIYRSNKRGLFAATFISLPKLALAVFAAALIAAIADPIMPVSGEESDQIAVRTRVDLRDVSSSMATPLPGEGGHPFRANGRVQSVAEIAAEAHLEFLRLRRGEGDRASFWLFSSDPFMIQDFIIGDEAYFLSVMDAPWVMTGGAYMPLHEFSPEYGVGPHYHPESRHAQVRGQGGTNLSKALRAVIMHFDEDEIKQKARNPAYQRGGRSVMIITDALVQSIDQIAKAIDELHKRDAIVYLIYIGVDPNRPGSSTSQQELFEVVNSRGGKCFVALNPGSLENAYLEINNLEKYNVSVSNAFLGQPVFYRFLFFAIIFLSITIVIGVISEIFGVYP